MAETLLLLGVACVIAAVVGGGLTIAKVAEIPLIDSWFRQVLLALVGMGLIGGSFAVPDRADRDPLGEAKITLSKVSGPPGLSVRIAGVGFGAKETARIRFHAQEIGVVQTDARGSFTGETIIIPRGWTPDGSFSIVATGEQSGQSASQSFEVPPASIELSPQSGPAGSRLRVVGSGYAVGESVEIELHLQRLAKVTADGQGRISASVTIPSDWPFDGEVDVTATGETSRRTASEPFRIT